MAVLSVALDWELEKSVLTVHFLNLEESRLRFLLQLSLSLGTLEVQRHLKTFNV